MFHRVCVALASVLLVGCSVETVTRVATPENFRNEINAIAQEKREHYKQDPLRIVEDMKSTPIPKEDLAYEPNIQKIPTKTDTKPPSVESKVKEKVNEYAPIPIQELQNLKVSKEGVDRIYKIFNAQVSRQWGNDETKGATQTVYVKYTNHYKSRASVDFENGRIKVETVDNINPQDSLKKALVATLLAPNNPDGIELADASDVVLNGKPYLADFIKDNEDKQVLYEWRANRYADHLIKNNSQKRVLENPKREVWVVEFDMEKDYGEVQNTKYRDIVAKYANANQIDPALVLGIIKTESSFNPYATSHIPAYGLMQVVPTTAGRDAYESIYGRKGTPTANMLYQPETNIQFGTTYLKILATRYLGEISDPQSLEYCMIAAYNAGAGTVLKAFHSDRKKALGVINQKKPEEVYRILRHELASDEGRRYLEKVTIAKKIFISTGSR